MLDDGRKHRENQRVQELYEASISTFFEVVVDTQKHLEAAMYDETVLHCPSSLPDVPMSDDPPIDFGTEGTYSDRSLARQQHLLK